MRAVFVIILVIAFGMTDTAAAAGVVANPFDGCHVVGGETLIIGGAESPVPDVKRTIEMELDVGTGSDRRRLPVVIFPKGPARDMKKLTEWKKIGIVDPDGLLSRRLTDRQVPFKTLTTRLSMRAFRGDLVIVNARDLGGIRDSLLDAFEPNVRTGLTVLLISPETIPLSFRKGLGAQHGSFDTMAFRDTSHPFLHGIDARHLLRWRPAGAVASVAYSTPAEGNVRVHALCSSLDTPLILEIPSGRGRYIFSCIGAGLESGEPVAQLLLDNVIVAILEEKPPAWEQVAVVIDTRTPDAQAFFSSLGAFGDTQPSFDDTYPLWLIEGKGEFLSSFLRERPRHWERFFARIKDGGETVIFLNADEAGLDLIEKYVSMEDFREDGHLVEDTMAFRKNPTWVARPPAFSRVPHKDGRVFFVELVAAAGDSAMTGRLWVNWLTAWRVQVVPARNMNAGVTQGF